MPDAVFDIVAEHEQKQHIPDDMQVIGMDKLAGEQGDNFQRGLHWSPPSTEESGGYEAIPGDQHCRVFCKVVQIDEYCDIGHNEGDIDPGRPFDFDVISVWNHPGMFSRRAESPAPRGGWDYIMLIINKS